MLAADKKNDRTFMADTAAAMDEIDADDGLVAVAADGAAKRQRTSKPESVKRAECLRNWQSEHPEVIAHVIHKDHLSLKAVVGQAQVDLVRQSTQKVEVRLAEDVWNPFLANVKREVPSASRELPSKALSLEGGGDIGLDPQAANEQGKPIALDHFFQFELEPLDFALPERMGARAHVRFEHPPEPIALQWYREIRQMFLRRFDL